MFFEENREENKKIQGILSDEFREFHLDVINYLSFFHEYSHLILIYCTHSNHL